MKLVVVAFLHLSECFLQRWGGACVHVTGGGCLHVGEICTVFH